MFIAKRLAWLTLVIAPTILFAQGNDVSKQIITLPTDSAPPTVPAKPLNDIVEKEFLVTRRALPYDDVREADIMWQKRLWRVIDTREKINLPFINPERPLITVFMEAAEEGKIELYSTIDDKFSARLSDEDLAIFSGGVDTVERRMADGSVEYVPVPREFDPAVVKRYRIQEAWYFDRESSTMKVRILGIAPIMDQYDEFGNYLTDLPMFWVYYPAARQMLANEHAYTVGNDVTVRSWADVFEMRYFNSYVIKESNALDRRIEDYLVGGRERMIESERINRDLFSFEQDLWSY